MDIINLFPDLHFEPDADDLFWWKPQARTIYYAQSRVATEQGKLQLLHEVAHALLHDATPHDAQRYQIERDAWDVARLLADKLGVKRDEYFISRSLRGVRRAGY
jgi:Zn-dependent peptidase ImmA (M78 family)